MADDETFSLAASADSARETAEVLFAVVAPELISVLPASAEVVHVGATAVPGCVTKGDLDIVVRVDRVDFAASEALLAKRFSRNVGSIRTDEFAAFEDPSRSPHLGVQLTMKGGAFDDFHQFVEELRRDPLLVRRYNDLKLRFNGKPMADYRAAKDAFVAEILSNSRRAE
jgi:GrpB-like predicted nucleotidyltransferase (UPF0157 family)